MSKKPSVWLVFAGCFLLSVGVNAFFIAPSSIGSLFVDRFGIPTGAVGNIVSAALLGTIVVQIPGGYLLDRFDNRWLALSGIGIYVGVILSIQFVESFSLFLVLRVLGGVVGGFVFTCGANVIGEAIPADRQGVASGLYLASPPIAFVLAHTTSPLIGLAFGPLRVFLLHALVALVGLVLFWAGASRPIRTASTPTRAEFARALTNRSVILVSLSAFATFALYLFLNSWMPTYGTTVLSLPLSTAGFVTALVPLVGIGARIGGGWLSTRLGGRRRSVIASGLLVGLILLLTIPFVGGFFAFVIALGAGAFALQLGFGVYYALVRELATAGTEGTSLTVMTTVGFTGSFVGPIAGGWLINTSSWSLTFGIFAILGVFGVIVLVPLAEPHPTTEAVTETGPDP